MSLPFIQTEKGLSLILQGRMRTVSAEDSIYAEVLDAVKAGADEAAIVAILETNLLRMTEAVKSLVDQEITGDVTICGGAVLFQGEEVHNSLADRMICMLDQGFDLTPMARFLENLMRNPSFRAVQDLYTFLEFGKMPITEDGCFLAYKAVNPDFTDIYSRTFSNAVGARLTMPRNQVNEDPTQTCSRGFHVCSFDYLPCFAHNNGHVMICKINPACVVAIPADYNNTKMRVSTYEVIGEYEGYYAEHRNVLADMLVATAEEPFLVTVTGHGTAALRYASLAKAAVAFEAAVEDAKGDDEVERVELRNGLTDVELDSWDNPDFDECGGDWFDEEEEEEFEDEAGYEVVYASSLEDLQHFGGTVYESGLLDSDDAESVALEAKKTHRADVVLVRNAETGEILLTLS